MRRLEFMKPAIRVALLFGDDDAMSTSRRVTSSNQPGLLSSPTFSFHVGHVVSMSPQEQMAVVNAGGAITGMADQHIFGDRTHVQLVGDSGGFRGSPSFDVHVSSSFRIKVAGPGPTLIRTSPINMFPKAILDRLGSRYRQLGEMFRSLLIALLWHRTKNIRKEQFSQALGVSN